MEDNSGIIPLEYYVLIKLDIVEEKTKGGIILIEEARERQEQAQSTGKIVSIGPLAFLYDVENDTIPQIGERVAFPKYGGLVQKGRDKAEYRLLKDGDIAAILTEETNGID
jgi:co-chaperonin GroES (HSP10)